MMGNYPITTWEADPTAPWNEFDEDERSDEQREIDRARTYGRDEW